MVKNIYYTIVKQNGKEVKIVGNDPLKYVKYMVKKKNNPFFGSEGKFLTQDINIAHSFCEYLTKENKKYRGDNTYTVKEILK